MVKIARYNLNKTVQKGQKKRKSLKKQELFWQKKKVKVAKSMRILHIMLNNVTSHLFARTVRSILVEEINSIIFASSFTL